MGWLCLFSQREMMRWKRRKARSVCISRGEWNDNLYKRSGIAVLELRTLGQRDVLLHHRLQTNAVSERRKKKEPHPTTAKQKTLLSPANPFTPTHSVSASTAVHLHRPRYHHSKSPPPCSHPYPPPWTHCSRLQPRSPHDSPTLGSSSRARRPRG